MNKRLKLLITTQVVDRTDPILGFFHAWIAELATQCERVTVICLREGAHDLPAHVRVISLGKEQQVPPNGLHGTPASKSHSLSTFLFPLFSRSRYIYRFYRYIWRERVNYDAVFVHMNQEYVLLAGLLWRLMGKRVTLWRNHYAGSMLTSVAARLCHRVFFTSSYSYTARYRNAVRMPVGIPDHLFYSGGVVRAPHSILSLGRITPSKKLEQLIDALGFLAARGVPFTATIAGGVSPEHEAYREGLIAQARRTGILDRIRFLPGVPYEETRRLYASHEVFVNLSKSGMLDKTMFEAMLCETLVATCNKDLVHELDACYSFPEEDTTQLVVVLEQLLTLAPRERRDRSASLRSHVLATHTLSRLAERVVGELI